MLKRVFMTLALVVSTASGVLADDGPSTMTNDAIGLGRHHDDAYNNAYAKNDSIMRAECAVLGGKMSGEQVDNESDYDHGPYGYEVHLTMEAQCTKPGANS